MDVLEGYTTEEIQELARIHLGQQEKDRQEWNLKIKKIDKKYKEHNKRSVINAISTGSIIVALSIVFMKSDVNISDFWSQELYNMLSGFNSEFVELMKKFPFGDLGASIYTKIMTGLETFIDDYGIMGAILASRSVSFITSTISNASKSIKMKRELNELQNKLEESYSFENERKGK